MSLRVVVLTDEEISALYFGVRWTHAEQSARAKLKAAHKHPGAVTEEMLNRAELAAFGADEQSIPFDTWVSLPADARREYRKIARAVLEVALFPGEDEQ